MGYESRIFFVERNTCFDGRVVIGSEISRFDLSKMGYYEYNGKSFREIFTQEIDFDLDINDSYGEDARIDSYGEHCKWATVKDVITWLEMYCANVNYRRAENLLLYLYIMKKQIEENKWSQICVVHYGY